MYFLIMTPDTRIDGVLKTSEELVNHTEYQCGGKQMMLVYLIVYKQRCENIGQLGLYNTYLSLNLDL